MTWTVYMPGVYLGAATGGDMATTADGSGIDGAEYRAFSVDHPVTEARARFREIYGVEPARAFVARGALRVGPVPALYEHPDTTPAQLRAWLQGNA